MKMNKTFKSAAFTLALLSMCGTAAFAQPKDDKNPPPAKPDMEAPAPAPIITVSGKVKVKGSGDNRVITMKTASGNTFTLVVAGPKADDGTNPPPKPDGKDAGNPPPKPEGDDLGNPPPKPEGDAPAMKPVTYDDLAAYKNKTLVVQGVVDNDLGTITVFEIGYGKKDKAPSEK